MKVPGISLDGLDDRVDEFVALCLRAAQRVATKAAKSLPGTSAAHVSMDDLNVMPVLWQAELDKTVLPAALGFFLSASDRQADLIKRAKKEMAALTAAVSISEPGDFAEYTIASESDAAQTYLAGARNRLVGIGDETWSAARTELVAGMQLGESVPKLAKRVSGAAGVGAKRATVIARTEVIGASNAGSIATMRQLGEVAKKEWLATGGPRTRPTHQSANGQIVDMDQPFSVGSASLDHPGDPSGPAREVINCRCTMTYDLTEDAAPITPEPIQAPDPETAPVEFPPADIKDTLPELPHDYVESMSAPSPPFVGAKPATVEELLKGVNWGDQVEQTTAAQQLAETKAKTAAIKAEADALAAKTAKVEAQVADTATAQARLRLAKQEAARAEQAASMASDEELAADARRIEAIQTQLALTRQEVVTLRQAVNAASGDELTALRDVWQAKHNAANELERNLSSARRALDSKTALRQTRGMAFAPERSVAWANENMPTPKTAAARLPVEQYTGTRYADWNYALREAASRNANILEDTKWGKSTARLDATLVETPLPQDTLLRRGVYKEEFQFPLGVNRDMQSLVGSVQTQSGYLSTSIGEQPKGYALRPVVIEFATPAGTPATWAEPYSRVKGENEILLGRGLRYYIHDVEYFPDLGPPGLGGIWKVYAEILPD